MTTSPEPPRVASRSVATSLSYPRALLLAGVLFVATALAGLAGAWATAAVAAAFVVFAAWRGVLRSPALVMAEVTWLVAGVALKLVFLATLPASPLPAIAGVLFVQFLAQLGHDLRAFADPSDPTPPVTYSVTFALAAVLALAAELFRVARTDYPYALGVGLAMALATSFLLLLALWWDWTVRAFSSLKMAVALLSLIGLGSVAGTVVIQHQPEDGLQAHYDKFMNGEGAAPVNARYLFQDPAIEWSGSDEARRVAMNEKFGPGQGDRWAKIVRHDRVKKAKETEGRAFVDANRRELHAFYAFCESARLTRIFKSWYFNTLLVLLAFSVVGVMIRRYPYDLRDAGWVTAHAGIVFLLVCFAGSDLAVQDGFIQLAPTASPGTGATPTEADGFEDTLAHDEEGAPRARTFGDWKLRLVRTSADWYQELAVAFVDDAGNLVAQQTYPVLAGRTIELERSGADLPRYRIEMLETLERSRANRVGYRAGKSTGVLAVQFLVKEEGRATDRWVTDEDGAPFGIPGGQLRVIAARDDADAARLAGPQIAPDTGAAGFVRVVAGAEDLVRVPATVGAKASFVHDGRTWNVTVTEAALDIQTAMAEKSRPEGERTPVERQVPGIGAATISLECDGEKPQRANAFSGEFATVANERMANPVLQQAGLSFFLDLAVPREVRVIAKPDGSLVWIEEVRGAVTAPQAFATGGSLPLAGTAEPLGIGAIVRDAELDADVEEIPAETDADYLKAGLAGVSEQVGRPAVKLRITEPSASGPLTYEQWSVGGDPWDRNPVIETRDRRVRLELVPTSESMYRSAVQAIGKAGEVLGEHVIRVNAPFRMRGFEFYQNQFVRPDQGGPMAVFRVKRDPFVPVLYAGFVLVSAGVIALLWFPGQRAFKLNAHLARLPEDGPGSTT